MSCPENPCIILSIISLQLKNEIITFDKCINNFIKNENYHLTAIRSSLRKIKKNIEKKFWHET